MEGESTAASGIEDEQINKLQNTLTSQENLNLINERMNDESKTNIVVLNSVSKEKCELNSGSVSEASMNMVQAVVTNFDPTLANIHQIVKPLPSESSDVNKKNEKSDTTDIINEVADTNKDAVNNLEPTDLLEPHVIQIDMTINDSIISNATNESKDELCQIELNALIKEAHNIIGANSVVINDQDASTLTFVIESGDKLHIENTSATSSLEKDHIDSVEMSEQCSKDNASVSQETSEAKVESNSRLADDDSGVSVVDEACVTSDISKEGHSEELVNVAMDEDTSLPSVSTISKESDDGGVAIRAPPASQQSHVSELAKTIKEEQHVEEKEQEEEPQALRLSQEEWERRENELLLKIMDLEKQKDNASVEGIRMQLKVREEENDLLKHKVRSLESELKAVLNNPDSNKNKELVADIKRQHDELLAKARSMIFDKTKMVRNQEKQIEALSGQVLSLKEVVGITKDLLGIRNMEVKHLRDRLDSTETKILAERERQKLLMQRVDLGMKKNEELRIEYTQQLSLFKDLREKYEAKVDDLRVENKKLADQIGDMSKNF